MLSCGSNENASCEQTVAVLATPTGSGFTVTVTVKGSPTQPPPVYEISSGWNANVESPGRCHAIYKPSGATNSWYRIRIG